MGGNPVHFLFFPIFCLPMLALHFLPTIIAAVRHAHNFGWILLVNLLLSWTVVGWVLALVWAICDQPRYRYAYYPPYPPYPPSPPPYNGR
jgi:hypothetical protein